MVSRIAPGLKHMDADLQSREAEEGHQCRPAGLLISGQTNGASVCTAFGFCGGTRRGGVFSLRAFSAPTDDPSAEALGK